MTELTEQQITDIFKDAPEGYNYYMPESDDWEESLFVVVGGVATKGLGVVSGYKSSYPFQLYLLIEGGAIKRPEPKEEANMIYTQEMADNDVLPSVGMRVIYNHCNPNTAEYKLKYHGKEVTIIAKVKDLFVLLSDNYGFTTICNDVWIKPLPPAKTELEIRKEKQVIDVAKELAIESCNVTDIAVSHTAFISSAKHLQEKGMLAEIILQVKG
jgi:hypothetical protein